MARLLRLTALMALALAAFAGPAAADNGNAGTTMSFFSGGGGGHADWLATDDQPPGDSDNQAVRLQTVFGGPTFEHGYAGILFHHVTGIPATVFPDSYFWNKTPGPYFGEPYTIGSPRLVVEFQTPSGQYDGDAQLTENVRGNDWEKVSDLDPPAGTYPNSGWDERYSCQLVNGSYVCASAYHSKWQTVQAHHALDTVLDAYIVADAYGIYHLIDDISVNGKMFSSASDNGNGTNVSAGPEATTDPALLPAFPIQLPGQ